MNILMLTNVYPHPEDINEDRTAVIAFFARKWVEQGHKVIVVVNSTKFPKAYYYVANKFSRILLKSFDITKIPNEMWTEKFNYDDYGVNVVNFPMKKNKPHGLFSQKVLEEQVLKIEEYLDRINFVPDIITGHWLNPQLFLVAGLGEKYKAKTAFVFHSDFYQEYIEKYSVNKVIDKIDRIGFRSHSAASMAKQYLNLKSSPFICYSGIPDEYVNNAISREKNISNTNINILSAGRLIARKNFKSVISATEEAFGVNKYHLEIAGDGPLKVDLQKFIDSNGMHEKVQLLGQISRETLQERMYRANLFVLISEQEVFGLVYLEAMLQGCIVIASKKGGMDGIIQDGKNGFVCEAGNETQLINIYKRIKALSIKELEEISNAAIKTASKFADTEVAKRYIDDVIR